MELPTQITKARKGLNDFKILLYGPPKIGKSTFCARFPHTLFLATEPGLNQLDTFQVKIQTWEDLKSAVVEIEKGKHPFQTIVIDTVDNAHTFCSEYVCSKLGIKHESDMGYGKGFDAVTREFRTAFNRLFNLPYGVILTSHSRTVEVKTRTGTRNRDEPTLPNGSRKVIVPMADMILYCDVTYNTETKEATRMIHTKPSTDYEAGDRTGLLPEEFPLDFNLFKKNLEKTQTLDEVKK